MRLLARWGTPFGGGKEQWLSPNQPDEWGRREDDRSGPGSQPGCLVLAVLIILIITGLVIQSG